MIVSLVFLFEHYPVALHVEERGLLKRNVIISGNSNSISGILYEGRIEGLQYRLSIQT